MEKLGERAWKHSLRRFGGRADADDPADAVRAGTRVSAGGLSDRRWLPGTGRQRTSPTAEQMAWIESGAIAAAAIIVLACLMNMLLIDMMLRQFRSDDMLGGHPMQQVTFSWRPLPRRCSGGLCNGG